MGFFDFWKKKEIPAPGSAKGAQEPVVVAAAAKGAVLTMEQVPDPIFSKGVLGRCCGIEPVEGKVFAPVDGAVTQVAETGHAIGFAGPGGVEVLLHIGKDTVDLQGVGFAPQVKVGDTVQKGQLVLLMELDRIKAAGYSATVITAVTNSDSFAGVELTTSGTVEPGADLLRVRK